MIASGSSLGLPLKLENGLELLIALVSLLWTLLFNFLGSTFALDIKQVLTSAGSDMFPPAACLLDTADDV